MMAIKYLLFILLIVSAISCSDSKQTEKLFQYFLDRHVEKIKPINKRFNEAIWVTYTGKKGFKDLIIESNRSDSLYSSFDKSTLYYQQLINNVYDNTSEFELLQKIKESGLLTDPLLKRQFIKVFRDYVSIQNNWDETEKRELQLFEQFYELKKTENRFWDSLGNVTEEEKRTQWIDKFSGLTGEFRQMILAVNNDVKRMGYDNYFQWLMDYSDIPVSDLKTLIQIIEQETREDYLKLLATCSEEICIEFNIGHEQITPMHYRSAHNRMLSPAEWEIDYSNKDFMGRIESYFALGGYDITDIYKNSDIWYKEDKMNSSFFFCADVEASDYRVYSNSKPCGNSYPALVHEFSHAVHYKYVDPKVPYLLRSPHTITEETVACYFDSKLFSSEKIQMIMGLASLEKNPYFKDFTDPSRLFFLRKLVRNIEFEMAIFENPGQDFNELWWRLNKKYLFFDALPNNRLPEWISNPQIVDFGCMHVFYLYAIALAAQLEAYYPNEQIGPLKSKIMKYGDTVPWNELIRTATGEELNLNYLFNSYRRDKKQSRPFTLINRRKLDDSFFES